LSGAAVRDFKTLPENIVSCRSYSVTAASMASLIAIPKLPGVSGIFASIALPALVSLLGLATQLAPPNLHHNFSERFLVETNSNHKYLGPQAR